MIDRESRDRLALALRRYAAKRITNDDLANAMLDSHDRGVRAVQGMAWRLYDDMRRHKAVGRHALDKDARRTVARWVLFLQTDFEYSWPDHDFFQTEGYLDRCLMDLFTLGRWSKRKREQWQDFVQAGDFDVWPFLRTCDEESARRKHV